MTPQPTTCADVVASIPWPPGWQVQCDGPRPGLLGATQPSGVTDLFVRTDETMSRLRVVALHEAGHAWDFARLDAGRIAQWCAVRGCDADHFFSGATSERGLVRAERRRKLGLRVGSHATAANTTGPISDFGSGPVRVRAAGPPRRLSRLRPQRLAFTSARATTLGGSATKITRLDRGSRYRSSCDSAETRRSQCPQSALLLRSRRAGSAHRDQPCIHTTALPYRPIASGSQAPKAR